LRSARRQRPETGPAPDRSLSLPRSFPVISRTPERLPFIQREGAFDYVVDASHRVLERRAAGMSYDSRERLSPFSPPQRELFAFWSHRLDSVWRPRCFS